MGLMDWKWIASSAPLQPGPCVRIPISERAPQLVQIAICRLGLRP